MRSPEESADPRLGSGIRHWAVRLALGAVLAVGIMSAIPSPWTVIRPGEPIDARVLARGPGGAHGEGLFIPILESTDARLSVAAWHRLRGSGRLIRTERARDEEREARADHGAVAADALFRDTYEIATLAGAEAANHPVRVTGRGVRVGAAKLVDDSPLRSGDVVVRYAGRPIATFGDLVAAVRGVPAGRRVTAELRGGDEVELPPVSQHVLDGLPRRAPNALAVNSVETVAPRVTGDGLRWRILNDVGGTSGGLALSLVAYERLSGTALDRYDVIHASGEVGSDGGVYAVGGIADKARAAQRRGADIFVVAAANARDARRAAPDLKVIGVRSVAEACAQLT